MNDAGGPELHHTVSGPAGAAPVVFLHGFMGNTGDWQEVVQELEHEFLCVGIDLPGHGRSVQLPSAEDYSFDGACRGVARVVDALRLVSPACVAYSMGGRVALALAVKRPRIFVRLLLESASPGLASASAREARAIVDDERAERLERGRLERFLGAWYAHPLFGSLAAKPGLRTRMIEDRLRNDPAELARVLRAMSTGRQPSYWDALPDLGLPLLALAGEQDVQYAELTPRMADLCPHGRSTIVPDAGHNIHRERPTWFVEALRTFLNATGEDTRD